jgi:hypothetical protein
MKAAFDVMTAPKIVLVPLTPGTSGGIAVIPPLDVHRNAVSSPDDPAAAAAPPTA